MKWYCKNDKCPSANKCARHVSNPEANIWEVVDAEHDVDYGRCIDFEEKK